jgi:hypothetical protein
MPDVRVPWFLWSTVYSGGSFSASDIRAQPVRQFVSQEE